MLTPDMLASLAPHYKINNVHLHTTPPKILMKIVVHFVRSKMNIVFGEMRLLQDQSDKLTKFGDTDPIYSILKTLSESSVLSSSTSPLYTLSQIMQKLS